MVIELLKKREILLMYFREGKSQRSIAKEVGVDKKTVASYIKEHESKLNKIIEQKGSANLEELIQSLVDKPKYKSSNRTKRVLTEEIENRIHHFIKKMSINVKGGYINKPRK
ncbi:hypothetical protein BKP45_01760 [Anaerobacillus alkalidiazotrophicus]|uniref:RNA polymerase sigma factor 70 region 4 type 2 domain-containing protein n=1 Tax=Anaerobacillus alkalidiazotrophicus TaxID=472963 RepID=A0A1S2MA22_9BACI|nr:sigma factor-like helix-turn-helix DNA-binding protein [Anaerobacillus alkalidiazotrophicus]OIJ21519.1 hypothetical protein BKP45_01760 [Anaerobacillus alkalidiazotrophicus]